MTGAAVAPAVSTPTWAPAWATPYLTWGWARAATETGLIALGLVAQFFLLPHQIIAQGYDGQIRFEMMNELLGEGRIDAARYSFYGPIFSAPLWYLGQVIGGAEYWLGRYNLILLALAVATLYWLLRDHLDHTILRTFLLLVVVASMFPNHIENYYGEVFTALTVVVGLTLVVCGRRWGWVGVALGVANAPASLAGLALVTAKHLLQHRRLRILLVGVVAGVLILGESWLRRGSPLDSGYAHDGGFATLNPFSAHSAFTTPFLFGLLSILISFGKGLFFYAPGILLPIRRRLLALGGAAGRRLLDLYGYWIAFLVGLILIYAKWWAWYGGWFWGPRFFLIASIPASFALAVWLRSCDQSLVANLVTLAVLLLSVWVGLDGAIFGQHDLSALCRSDGYRWEMYCFYTPAFSALFHPLSMFWLHGFSPLFIAKEQLTPDSFIYAGYVAIALVYLAAPLIWRIARQVRALLRPYTAMYLRPGAWRV